MLEPLIKNNKYCQDCPYRLYQKENDKIKQGVGNICGNGIIIVEQRQYIDILKDIYYKITSKNLLDDYYVIPLLNCDTNIHLKYCPTALTKCANNLIDILSELSITKVIVCGPLYHFLAQTGSKFKYFSSTHRIIYISNPAVKYYANSKAVERFDNQFMYALNIYD